VFQYLNKETSFDQTSLGFVKLLEFLHQIYFIYHFLVLLRLTVDLFKEISILD